MNDKKRTDTTSRQIAVYKTDRKLLEFIDKLNVAPTKKYAHLHAQGEKVDGRRVYSNIGVVLQDYSNGTGDKNIKVYDNLSPDDIQFIYSKIISGALEFNMDKEKIFGNPNEDGYSIVKKMRVIRASKDKSGKIRNYPWYIEIQNGLGIAAKTKNGGTYCKRDSYKCDKKAFVNINDIDFFRMINQTNKFIVQWESTISQILISKGRKALKEEFNKTV